MLATHDRPITRPEYNHLPFGGPKYQLNEGDHVMAPSPESFHQGILGDLAGIFRGHLLNHPIGKSYITPLDVYLSETNVDQPDLFFVRKENLAITEEQGVEGAPDLAVEILSKTTSKYDFWPKRSIYARTGGEERRVIDPVKRKVARDRLGENAETPTAVYRGKQALTSAVLPGLTVPRPEIFAS